MAGVRSSYGYLGIAKQTAKGTGVAPTKFIRLSAAEFIEQVQETMDVRSLSGDEELETILKKFHRPDGSFQTLARPDAGAFLLAMILGADSVSGTESPYTHTITRANTLPWLTIERKLESAERIIDCKLNQITISGESGNPVLLDVSFMGTDSSIESAATPSYETNDPFMFYQGTYTLDGGAVTTVNSFSIVISRNLEEVFTTGYIRNDFVETLFNIDVSLRLKFEDDTLYKNILYGGGTSPSNVLDDGSLVIDLTYGSGADLKEFKIELPQLKHLSAAKHLDPDSKAVYLDVSSRAVKGASEIITVTVKNEISGAYV